MALVYVMINEEGEIVRSMSPGDVNMIPDRSMVDGLLVVHAEDKDVKDVSVIYWDFETSMFKPRERKNNPYKKWKNKKWEIDASLMWYQLRQQRNHKLLLSDWTQLTDAPLTEIQKELWRVYRQKLRDIPQDNPDLQDIEEVQWPQAPGE